MDKRYTPDGQRLKRRILGFGIILLFLYVAVPQFTGLGDQFELVLGAHKGYLAAALDLLVVTYMLASAVLYVLAAERISFGRTLVTQLAAAFAGKLLPAGLGGATLNVQYLRKARHTIGKAVAVMAANNLLGLIGNLVILAVLAVSNNLTLPTLHIPAVSWRVYLGTVALLLAIGVAISVSARARQALGEGLRDSVGYIAAYRRRPLHLLAALGFAMLQAMCFVGILYLCARAMGYDLALPVIFVVFSLGMVAGTATPTPGGLVGAEAGLSAGLVAYGLAVPHAVAIALLYRFMTYWLPLLPGIAAFWYIRRKGYI